jgi:23S rRNA pseudouridine2605 synthase
MQKRFGLARALSKKGYCSRSQAAVLIRAGRVAVNGQKVLDPERPVRIEQNRIEVDGAEVSEAVKVYLVMNKPPGLVTTTSDEQGRRTVYDLLAPGLPWVGPVGRLDKASEGLLLLTNDSQWAARITDPASHLDKKYHVQVNCLADDALFKRMVRGVFVEEELLRVKAARILRQGVKNCWLEITLDEGKNRHIRRLLDALGVEVLHLVRVGIGPLELGDLKKGAVRGLDSQEKLALDRAVKERDG